jgi:hypothetical protein
MEHAMNPMKQHISFTPVGALALSAAILASCATSERIDLLGESAAPHEATRTIAIKPDTTYVNVTGGDLVSFVVGDKIFVWKFDGPPTVWAFDLNKVTPPGLLDHVVTAYIAPNPQYDTQ